MFTKVVRPVPEAPVVQTSSQGTVHPAHTSTRKSARWHATSANLDAQGLTDDHNSELDTLLDLVASAPASERHGCNGGWSETDAG